MPYSKHGNTSLLPDSLVSGTHLMSAVTVRNKRGGLRKLNLKKPTLVVDAYEAFNLAADYGLNSGMYDWRTFTKQVCTAYIGDMNQSRHYFIQERYDSLPLNHKDKTLPVGVAITNQTEAVRRKYHKLYNLDKLTSTPTIPPARKTVGSTAVQTNRRGGRLPPFPG